MNKKRLNQIIKQFLIVIVVFSLIFPVNLSAKKKRGAKLWVTMLTGETIRGELLRVKVDEGTFLLMTSAAKTGANININDVYKIRIRKKSKWLAGFVVTMSFVLCGIVGGGGDKHYIFLGAIAGIMYGIPAGAVAMLFGARLGIDKKNQVKGIPESEKKRILSKLKSKARYKD